MEPACTSPETVCTSSELPIAVDVEVTACGLDPGRTGRLVELDVAGGGLHLECAVFAARPDLGGLRPCVDLGAAWAADPQADIRSAEAKLRPTRQRDRDAVTRLHLDDDLVALAAAHHVEPSGVDELVAPGDRLELDVCLVGVARVDLDLARRNLEVEQDRAWCGEGLAPHQRMKRPALKYWMSPVMRSRACIVFSYW